MTDNYTGGRDARWRADGLNIRINGAAGAQAWRVGKASHGMYFKPGEANARLMAAAPQMLEALRAVVDDYAMTELTDATRDALHAAIASATGEEG